jgi:opacity protein-like surface antigen
MSRTTSGYAVRESGRRCALALAAAALAGAAGSAWAEETWYVRGSAGLALQADADGARLTDDSGRRSADASFDPGYGVGAAVGRWFGPRWRADLGFDYRSVSTDRIEVDDGRVADDGNYASAALSLNGYYHFTDAGAVRRFSPYVGAGIAWLNEIDIDIEGGDFRPSYDDLEDDGFGFQLIGGVSWRQTERIRWDAELRWLYYGEADLDDGNGVRLEDVDYAPVTVQVGFSYGF